MTNDNNEDYLRHYASEFYDPVKAHEYYVKNRELKGDTGPKTEAQKVTDKNQREASSYVKKEISERRKADLESVKAAQEARLIKLKQKAETAKAEITAKLEKLFADIQKAANALIKIPEPDPIPENASPKLRAFMEEQNRVNAEKAQKQNANVRKQASKATQDAKRATSLEIRKVGEELRGSVNKARAEYKASRDQLVAKYKQATTTELDNIKQQIQ